MADEAVATMKFWKVAERASDKHPLLTGSFKANRDIRKGEKLRTALWNGKDDDGTYTLQGRLNEPREAEHQRPRDVRSATDDGFDGLDDPVPF